jgi:hypothetical protein
MRRVCTIVIDTKIVKNPIKKRISNHFFILKLRLKVLSQ